VTRSVTGPRATCDEVLDSIAARILLRQVARHMVCEAETGSSRVGRFDRRNNPRVLIHPQECVLRVASRKETFFCTTSCRRIGSSAGRLHTAANRTISSISSLCVILAGVTRLIRYLVSVTLLRYSVYFPSAALRTHSKDIPAAYRALASCCTWLPSIATHRSQAPFLSCR